MTYIFVFLTNSDQSKYNLFEKKNRNILHLENFQVKNASIFLLNCKFCNLDLECSCHKFSIIY